MGMCVCVHACVFAGQYITLGATLLWDRVSHWHGTLHIGELTWERASGSPPLQPWDYKWALPGQTFPCRSWGANSCPCVCKAHTLPSCPPSPSHTFQKSHLCSDGRTLQSGLFAFCLVLALWLLACICTCTWSAQEHLCGMMGSILSFHLCGFWRLHHE